MLYVDERERRQGRGESGDRRNEYVLREGKKEMNEIYTEELGTIVKWDGPELKGSE